MKINGMLRHPLDREFSFLYCGFQSHCVTMECYAAPSRLWRAAIYCGTLWLPPSTPLFVLFSVFFTPFGLAGLIVYASDGVTVNLSFSKNCGTTLERGRN